MSDIPRRFSTITEQALAVVTDACERDELRHVVNEIASAAWLRWLVRRPPEDNRQEHEWIVLGNILRIAERECLVLSEKRIAVGFVFLHDTCFIPRITERAIRSAVDEATRAQLLAGKETQRLTHMEGGARNARLILSQLAHPLRADEPLFSPSEIDRCTEIIAGHDLWKLRRPHPPGRDRLAVACLEADALWPLHPLGVLADLERPDEFGRIKAVEDPAAWREQLRHSLTTLLDYRANWSNTIGESFQDAESIFRTVAGHKMYRDWRAFWNV